MSEPTTEQLTAALEKMVRAGWVQSFDARSGCRPIVKWTEEGEAAIEAAHSLLDDLGGDEAGEGTWAAIGHLMKLRHYGAEAKI